MTTAPDLAELLAGFAAAPPIAVRDIASDSRRLGAGAVFLACRGGRAHALDYLDATEASRLAAIVWDGDAQAVPPAGVPAVRVPDLRRHLGDIANRFFGRPSADVAVTGVTGTNGKSTVAWLLAQCRQRLGQRCGYIGTLGAGIDEILPDSGLTTPDCIELHRQLARFRDAGAAQAALEVSSHALTQRRLDGIALDAALFTNLSRDHLDYHGDMAAYGAAKARLFCDFAPRLSVICIDSEFGRELAARRGRDAVVVATGADANVGGHRFVRAGSYDAMPRGMELCVASSWGEVRVELPLYGAFNVANALTVLATLLADGVGFDDGIELLAGMQPPPGRMQPVGAAESSSLPRVFIDYAHTPAALEAALAALRPHCRERLWCVFGCGGDRDRGKRPQMGQVALAGADCPVLTSDNPRSEDPVAIMRDVARGLAQPLTAIEDRAAAIAWAIARAGSGDAVLIAGKGHEDYQLVGDRRQPFSDYRVAAECLRRRQP